MFVFAAVFFFYFTSELNAECILSPDHIGDLEKQLNEHSWENALACHAEGMEAASYDAFKLVGEPLHSKRHRRVHKVRIVEGGNYYAMKVYDLEPGCGGSDAGTESSEECIEERHIHEEIIISTMLLRHELISSIRYFFKVPAKDGHPHQCVFVTDYEEDGDLFDFAVSLHAKNMYKPYNLPEGVVGPLLYQLLEVTAHMHEKRIWYRDMKPDNILLGKNGLIKLTDFGLAKRIPPGVTKLHREQIGTPDWWAPEIEFEDETYDEKIDAWGVGAVALAVFNGWNALVDEKVREELCENHIPIGQNLPVDVQLVPKEGDRLYAVLLSVNDASLLQKNPEARASCVDMRERVAGYARQPFPFKGAVETIGDKDVRGYLNTGGLPEGHIALGFIPRDSDFDHDGSKAATSQYSSSVPSMRRSGSPHPQSPAQGGAKRPRIPSDDNANKRTGARAPRGNQSPSPTD